MEKKSGSKEHSFSRGDHPRRAHYLRDLWEQGSMLTGARLAGRREDDYLLLILEPFEDKQIKSYLEKTLGTEGLKIKDGNIIILCYNLIIENLTVLSSYFE